MAKALDAWSFHYIQTVKLTSINLVELFEVVVTV